MGQIPGFGISSSVFKNRFRNSAEAIPGESLDKDGQGDGIYRLTSLRIYFTNDIQNGILAIASTVAIVESLKMKEMIMDIRDTPFKALDITDDPYTFLDIGARATRILKRLNVKTIDDLLKISKKQIAAQSGAGVRTVSEIMKLRQTCKEKLVEPIERSALLDSPVEKVVKDKKSRRALKKFFDISTVGDMLRIDPDALALPKGYGKLTLKRIRAYIKEIRPGFRPGFRPEIRIEEEDESIEITTFSTEDICNLFPFFGARAKSDEKDLAVQQLNLDEPRIPSISPPNRISNRFSDGAPLSQLLEMSSMEFRRVDGIGMKTYVETRKCILKFISELRRRRKEEIDRPKNVLKDFPLFNKSPGKTSPGDFPDGFEANRSVKWLSLDKYGRNALRRMNISTVGQLLTTQIDKLRTKGCGSSTRKKLRKAFENYYFGLNWKPDMSSPVSMLEDIFKREVKDPRIVRVFMMRNAVAREGGMKLREIGAYFNLTRERIRQLKNEAWSVIEHPFICRLFQPCFDALYKAFSEKSYILSPRDAQWRFQELMKWTDVLPIRILIRLHDNLDMDDYAFRQFHVGKMQYIWLAHAACDECERLMPAIRDRAIPDGSMSMEKWVEIIARCVSETCGDCATPPAASRELGYYFLKKIYGKGNYFVEDSSIIYTGKAAPFRLGAMQEAMLAILEDAPGAMTFDEIQNRLHQLHPEKEKFIQTLSLMSAIHRAPEAIFWGSGCYSIHRKHVRTTTPLLAGIEREAIDLVYSGVPLLSTHRFFSEHERECVAAGIPNKYALYSCLKLRNSPRLAFPHAPYIMKPGYDTESWR